MDIPETGYKNRRCMEMVHCRVQQQTTV